MAVAEKPALWCTLSLNCADAEPVQQQQVTRQPATIFFLMMADNGLFFNCYHYLIHCASRGEFPDIFYTNGPALLKR